MRADVRAMGLPHPLKVQTYLGTSDDLFGPSKLPRFRFFEPGDDSKL